MNRKNDSSMKPIKLIIFLLNGEAGFKQILQFISIVYGTPGDRIFLFPGITKLKFYNDIISESALMKIRQSDGTTFLCIVEIFRIVFLGKQVQSQHTFSVIFFLKLFPGNLLFSNLNVILPGKIFQRFRIRKLFMFHEKGNNIASDSGTKTFKNSFGRTYKKRRSFFISEGA